MKGHNDANNSESFCKAKGKNGVNMQYLIDNANKSTYVTLIAVNKDHFKDDYLEVNAILIFRWTKTANALKIQVLCGDQRKKGTGDGTKLLNTVKKTLTVMGLNDIFLNPIGDAVPYYHKQNFRETKNPDGIIHDSSVYESLTSKSKSKSKTKSKSKSKSKSKTKSKSKIASPIYLNPLKQVSNKIASNKSASKKTASNKSSSSSHLSSIKRALKEMDLEEAASKKIASKENLTL
jgi:RNA polymerase-associated protein CTR9/transcription factor SPN1